MLTIDRLTREDLDRLTRDEMIKIMVEIQETDFCNMDLTRADLIEDYSGLDTDDLREIVSGHLV